MKVITKVLFVIGLTICFSLFAEQFNFKKDAEYQKILDEHPVIARNWVAAKKDETPKELFEFSTTNSDLLKKDKEKGEAEYLVPDIVLNFDKNGKFKYLWKKNEQQAGTIIGSWKIENGTLILALSQSYTPLYRKGSQFRYKILGADNLKTFLVFEGTHSPPSTGILNSSSSPLADMNEIVEAIEQQMVKDKMPKIMQDKEESLKNEILQRQQKSS